MGQWSQTVAVEGLETELPSGDRLRLGRPEVVKFLSNFLTSKIFLNNGSLPGGMHTFGVVGGGPYMQGEEKVFAIQMAVPLLAPEGIDKFNVYQEAFRDLVMGEDEDGEETIVLTSYAADAPEELPRFLAHFTPEQLHGCAGVLLGFADLMAAHIPY